MSADGDIVRADIVNAARTEIAKVDHGLASEPWAVRPLLQALDAALARLEAVEAQTDELRQLAHRLDEEAVDLRELFHAAEAKRDEYRDWLDAMDVNLETCMTQRDALAEALREIELRGESWEAVLARGVLTETGLGEGASA